MVEDIKIIGYCALHYGAEYLRESLLSIRDVVDKFVVVYSPKPSYGFGTDVPCPETEFELIKIALEVLGDKLVWHNQVFGSEGEHRSYIYNHTEGYNVMITIDADEVFKTDELIDAIKKVHEGDKWHYGVTGYINFWRSFGYYCRDGYTPIRLTNLKNKGQREGTVDFTIYHFSCAQSRKIMDYKYAIHGHKHELRANWLDEIYYKWNPENQFNDVHPVAHGIWNPVVFDKTILPESLKQHPNFNKEIID